jgi:hypothetical protein
VPPVPIDIDVEAERPGGGIIDEVFDELRFLEPEGCVGPFASGSGCVKLVGSVESSTNGAFDVVDVVLATEAECARRTDNSRVSLFTCRSGSAVAMGSYRRNRVQTIASCSFSSSLCNSAGVNGLGCRIGIFCSEDADGLRGGNGWNELLLLLVDVE